jgi:hypothetical protein
MVALPDRTAFQGMRQQTVANARNLDSVAIAPPVSTAPPPRPEVDPAVRAPTPVDLYRTASNSYFNRLNSDQNYLSLMQQIQNLSAQLQNYVNNTYAPDLQRLQSLNNQANQYSQVQQQQQQLQQQIPFYGEQVQRRLEEEQRIKTLNSLQQRQEILQPAPPQILAPPPKPEVDPEEKIPESFTPSVPTSTNTNMVVDPIRQPFVPKPVKPEVDPEEKILKVPDRKSTTDYEDFVKMTGGGGRPLVDFKPADTTGAKHSGQGIGGQGGIPALPNRGPQMIVDPIRQPFVPKPPKPEVDPEENIPTNTLVSKPKRKAGMAPSQYGGINTNVRGLMG